MCLCCLGGYEQVKLAAFSRGLVTQAAVTSSNRQELPARSSFEILVSQMA